MNANLTRRGFVEHCTAVSATVVLSAWTTSSVAGQRPESDWTRALQDPAYGMIPGRPDLDRVLALFPRTTGKPAFDPQLIAENIKRLQPAPPIQTGHPFLDLSVKTGLAHIDATFRGDHPKYGVGTYAQDVHDGFPPTIIAAVDALSAWGMGRRAAELFRYWLAHFVRDDGTIKYYGPSISEYGQLLHTAALLEERAGAAGWWAEGSRPWTEWPSTSCGSRLRRPKTGRPHRRACLKPTPARTRADTSTTTPGWSRGCGAGPTCASVRKLRPTTTLATVRKVAAALAEDTLRAIRQGVARRSGRLVAAAASRAVAKARAPHGQHDRLLHELPLLAGIALQRPPAGRDGQPGRRSTPRGRRAVLRHDAVRRATWTTGRWPTTCTASGRWDGRAISC